MTAATLFLLAGVVAVILTINLYKQLAAERLAKFSELRRASSQQVSRGQIVDGRRHENVALALTQTSLIYENSHMHGSLDREWIQEVGYEDELATGERVGSGKVMRIRCFSKTFEFVLPWDVVREWQAVLPAHR